MKTPTLKALLTLLVFTEVSQADPLDTWTWLNPPPTQNALYSVVYGNGKFLAVGDAGIVLTSADGVKWAQHLAQQPEGLTRLIDVVYGNEHCLRLDSGVRGYRREKFEPPLLPCLPAGALIDIAAAVRVSERS